MRSAAGSSGGVHAGTHEKAETGFGLRMENFHKLLTKKWGIKFKKAIFYIEKCTKVVYSGDKTMTRGRSVGIFM